MFKCFYFDIGLLNAALNSPININLEDLGSYKGYIAENFIAISLFKIFQKQLVTYKKSAAIGSAEIEFIITNNNGEIIPIEVKSSKKSLSSKSLDSFVKTYKPKSAFKLVPQLREPIISKQKQNKQQKNKYDEFKEKGYLSIPLYLIDKIGP